MPLLLKPSSLFFTFLVRHLHLVQGQDPHSQLHLQLEVQCFVHLQNHYFPGPGVAGGEGSSGLPQLELVHPLHHEQETLPSSPRWNRVSYRLGLGLAPSLYQRRAIALETCKAVLEQMKW